MFYQNNEFQACCYKSWHNVWWLKFVYKCSIIKLKNLHHRKIIKIKQVECNSKCFTLNSTSETSYIIIRKAKLNAFIDVLLANVCKWKAQFKYHSNMMYHNRFTVLPVVNSSNLPSTCNLLFITMKCLFRFTPT